MADGAGTYARNLDLYRLHMREAAKRSVRVRTTQIQMDAIQMVGFDSGDLMRSTNIRFRDGGMTGEVSSGKGLDYAAHHHFPGRTRNWRGNPYMRVPFDRHAPKLVTDLTAAHAAFRPPSL